MKTEKLSTDIRKEQIIKSTLEIIRSKGLKAVTIAGIAEKIGLVPSALYRHYSGKDDILADVLDFIDRNFKSNIAAARKRNKEPLSILEGILDNQVKMMLNVTPVFPRILLSDEIFSGKPQLKEKVRGIFDSFLGSIKTTIEEGQKAGSIKKNVPAGSLAVLFIGLFQPPAFFLLLHDGDYDIKKQISDSWAVFKMAIMK